MSEAVLVSLIGLFSGSFGIGIFKIIEKFMGRSKERQEADSGLRVELRLDLDRRAVEIMNLKKEIQELEAAADKWRLDYWALFEIFFQIKMLTLQVALDNPHLKAQLESILAPHEQKIMKELDERTED